MPRANGRRLANLLALALCIGACARHGPRDVGNQNPRSEFEDPGAGPAPVAGRLDAGGEPGRVIASPSPAGAKPRELARASAHAIATSPTHVLFGDTDDDALLSVPKTGGSPERIARRAPATSALAVAGGQIAWIAGTGDVVLRIATPGAPVMTVREGSLFTDVAIDGQDVFFTEATGTKGILTRASGTTTARLATTEGSPRGVAIDAEHVYVATAGRIVRATRTRGVVTTIAAGEGLASPLVDDAWVYATAVDGRAHGRILVRVRKTGGELETIATGLRDASIALHDGAVYWLDADRPALLAVRTSAVTDPARLVSEDAMLERVAALTVDRDGVFLATGYGESARIVVLPP